MPVLNDANMNSQTLPTGQYGYSATRLDDLGAAEYTLVTIVCDVSPSVGDFVKEMERALQEIIKACKFSSRSDNLLVRLVTFHGIMQEAHGFKLLDQCKLDDYKSILQIGSATALYDAAENAIAATSAYGKQLTDADFDANAIVFVITDGEDNASTLSPNHVRNALRDGVQSEALASLVSILIGVNVKDKRIGGYLQDFKNEAGFNQYVELDNANADTLARLAAFVMQSISVMSSALGTGSRPQSLGF